MPIYRRLPKVGFTNIFAKTYCSVNIERLSIFDGSEVITAELLKQKGIISKINDGIVILGRGEVTSALTVEAARFTKTAKEKIEKAGGKAVVKAKAKYSKEAAKAAKDAKTDKKVTDKPAKKAAKTTKASE
jgi:large subunit ribosomal protein L15